jgi:hypothetical protein
MECWLLAEFTASSLCEASCGDSGRPGLIVGHKQVGIDAGISADFWISGMDLGEGTSSKFIWKPRKIEKGKFKWIEPHKQSKYVRQVDNVSLFDFSI